MAGAAIEDAGVQVGAGVVDETAEKIFDQLSLQIADQADLYLIFISQRGTAGKVDGDDGQGFIHWHHKIPSAVDAFTVAKGFGEQLAEHDADVFDGVVLVDIEIAIGREFQIEAAVLGKELQHVIEKPDAGGYFVAAAAFDAKRAGDPGLGGVAIESGGSHSANTSSR